MAQPLVSEGTVDQVSAGLSVLLDSVIDSVSVRPQAGHTYLWTCCFLPTSVLPRFYGTCCGSTVPQSAKAHEQ